MRRPSEREGGSAATPASDSVDVDGRSSPRSRFKHRLLFIANG
jgi:hypothetical protein